MKDVRTFQTGDLVRAIASLDPNTLKLATVIKAYHCMDEWNVPCVDVLFFDGHVRTEQFASFYEVVSPVENNIECGVETSNNTQEGEER